MLLLTESCQIMWSVVITSVCSIVETSVWQILLWLWRWFAAHCAATQLCHYILLSPEIPQNRVITEQKHVHYLIYCNIFPEIDCFGVVCGWGAGEGRQGEPGFSWAAFPCRIWQLTVPFFSTEWLPALLLALPLINERCVQHEFTHFEPTFTCFVTHKEHKYVAYCIHFNIFYCSCSK